MDNKIDGNNTSSKDCKSILNRYAELRNLRNPFEQEWRKCAFACLPGQWGLWNNSNSGYNNVNAIQNMSIVNTSQQQQRVQNIDTTAQRALPKYVSLISSMLTPQSQKWHSLGCLDKDLMKVNSVKEYFDEVCDLLFKYRYDPKAGFETAQFNSYNQLGVYGTGIKFISKNKNEDGLLYRQVSLREIWLGLDDTNNVDTVIRSVPNMNCRNVVLAFGRENAPACVLKELDKANPDMNRLYNIIHVIYLNKDIDNKSFKVDKKFKYVGRYICQDDECFIGEPEGYNTLPYIIARDYADPGIPYGISAAQKCLGNVGSANAILTTIVQQAQKTVNPPVLAYDATAISGRIGFTPGSVIWGGLDAEGRELIKPVQLGDLSVGDKILEDQRSAIEDAFYVNLYNILAQDQNMTATEVMERSAEKASLLSPLMGRLQSTDLGPLIERELDILSQLELLPPMPIELQQSKSKVRPIYTSPLARQQNSESISNYMKVVAWTAQSASQTQDPSLIARLNLNEALVDICYDMGVPTSWLRSDQEVQAIMQQQQQAEQVNQLSKAAPAIAGMAKAQAVAQQAGGSLGNVNAVAPAQFSQISGG